MCERANQISSSEDIADAVDVEVEEIPPYLPQYNISREDDVVVVHLAADGKRVAAQMKWGFIPSWSKDKPIQVANARAEKVASSGMYRSAYRRRRCIVPFSGFYEWPYSEVPVRGQPATNYKRRDGKPMCMAGLWEEWHEVERFLVITTDPNPLMLQLPHHRMPVILDPQDVGAWLDLENEEAHKLLVPCPEDWLTAECVGTYVNNTRHEGPKCLEPFTPPSDDEPFRLH
jgi:putative SOS response-associated peptidase YedK